MFKLLAGLRTVFPWKDSIAAFSDKSFRYGRWPVARLYPADADRSDKLTTCEKRMMEPVVTALFESFDRLHQLMEFFDCTDALQSYSSMRGPPLDMDAKCESPCSDRTNRHARRFQNDGSLGAISANQSCKRTGATGFFPDYAFDENIAARADVQILQGGDCGKSGNEAPFHVTRAAPPQSAISYSSAPRTVSPGPSITFRNDVDVPIEDEGTRIGVGPTPTGDDYGTISNWKTVVGERRMPFQFVTCGTPRVDFKAHLPEALFHSGLRVLFLASNARSSNKSTKEINALRIQLFNGFVNRFVSGSFRHVIQS